MSSIMLFFFECFADHRQLHSFPTRRSSDLPAWPIRRPIVGWRALVASAWRLLEVGTGLNLDRKSTRLNSSHRCISYAVFCLKKTKREAKRVSCKQPLAYAGDRVRLG